MLDIHNEKENMSNLIANTVKEILYQGMRLDGASIGTLEKEIDGFMKALQTRNKIYDYAVSIIFDDLFNHFNGKIAYSLINTENMDEFQKNKMEDLIEFNF